MPELKHGLSADTHEPMRTLRAVKYPVGFDRFSRSRASSQDDAREYCCRTRKVVEETTLKEAVPETAVREVLARILASPMFVASGRLRRFLQYTVDSVFNGTAEQLKESWIATEVYDRGADFDPSQGSIVRTEARRLRNKLKEYYDVIGKHDPIVIQLRPGSYVPSFRQNVRSESESHAEPLNKAAVSSSKGEVGTSIAVMPFVDVSGQPLSIQCAKNLTNELIHGFMHTEGVRVAALGVTPSDGDLPALAKSLGVQIIFQGTVSQENNRLRVISSLANAEGFQVWSQRFEANADAQGLFVLTEQLASSLISRTRPEVSDNRKRNAPVSEAVIALLPNLYGAESLLDTGTAADLQSALAKFKAVADRLPDFARPYVGMAQCHYLAAIRGGARPAASVSLARQAAVRAIALEPEMITAQTAMGCVHALAWEWEPAEVCFQKALELGEHPTAHRHYALFLTTMKRFDEAFYHLQKAQAIDPFAISQKIASTLFFSLSGRLEEASRSSAEQMAFGALPVRARLYMALALFQAGQLEEAKRAAQENRIGASGEPALVSLVAEILARCGEIDLATQSARQFRLLSPDAPISGYRQALLALALGRCDEVLPHLERACADKDPELVWLEVEPRFDPIRAEPRFIALLGKVMPPLVM